VKAIFAKVVYQFRPFPYVPFTSDRAEAMRGRDDMQLVRAVMVPRPLPPSGRDLIVVLKRNGARAFKDHAGVMTAAQRAVDSHKLKNLPASNLKVFEFDKPGTAKEDIAIFKRARVILAGHGAGVYNAMWAGKGTSVIEVCYTTGMPCPAMYATIVWKLDQEYFSLVANGDYGGAMSPTLFDIEEIVRLALQAADKNIK
jgi:hypothetical protein